MTEHNFPYAWHLVGCKLSNGKKVSVTYRNEKASLKEVKSKFLGVGFLEKREPRWLDDEFLGEWIEVVEVLDVKIVYDRYSNIK